MSIKNRRLQHRMIFYTCWPITIWNQFQIHLYLPTYLQAGRTTSGIWAKTMEKGATVMGSDEFTVTASNGGMSPYEFRPKIFPFSNIIWLCKSPSFAVKWYSSLSISPILLSPGRRILFLPLIWIFLFCVTVKEPWKATLAWTVVALSRLINNNVIPCCKVKTLIKILPRAMFYRILMKVWNLTYGILGTMSVCTYLLCPRKACW